MNLVLSVLGKVGMSMMTALLTEAVLKKLIILLLEKLAEKSDNKVDDEIVRIVKEALAKSEG